MAVSAEKCVNVSQVGEIQQHASRQLLGWNADCTLDNRNHLMQPESQSIDVHDTGAAQCWGICAWFGVVSMLKLCI